MPAQTLRERLLHAGLLIETGVEGVYGHSAAFETVLAGCNAYAGRMGAADGAEVLRFPPLLNRTVAERNRYAAAFPQLGGHVFSFDGDDDDHQRYVGKLLRGEDCSCELTMTRSVLTPAACYPVYPALAARGPLPAGGCVIDVLGECFRHEPSAETARLQSFRMREYIYLGDAGRALAFRDLWMERSAGLLRDLDLPGELAVAHDPFFGRLGARLADAQVDRKLKMELVIPIGPDARPTACMSFNCHLDHFASIWDLTQADGTVAHTACVGFGLERLTLALFSRHGLAVAAWPAGLRGALGL
ncbi:amino acid--[acyl-carrier-protein] ligase [Acidisphaera rubrifaciens]|uniref:amino acid--[acyl-carrier-protein] ligase n=1 Tax=Acidisphaera rubrifaciens TaxID=50715 RepID=UPI001F52B162|nr:amino acid--[acyl-carrier-protein] ligase [Acidisphaera rubrifaciens]